MTVAFRVQGAAKLAMVVPGRGPVQWPLSMGVGGSMTLRQSSWTSWVPCPKTMLPNSCQVKQHTYMTSLVLTPSCSKLGADAYLLQHQGCFQQKKHAISWDAESA